MLQKTIISLLTTSVILADNLSEKTNETLQKKKQQIPALELLPTGSILKKISIPRYNPDYTPSSLLTAEQFEVISEEEIKGTKVGIALYDEKGNIRTRSMLNQVNYNQHTGFLTSKENLTFSGKSFSTSSQGVIIDWKNQRGFLLGKNQTIIYIKKQISMNNSNKQPVKKHSPTEKKTTMLNGVKAAAATAIITSTPLTAQESDHIDQLAQPSTALIIKDLDQTKAAIIATAEAEKKIANIRKELNQQLGKIPTIDDTQPAPPQLAPIKGREYISIKSDKLLFDAKKGIFVYHGNIRIKHPKYSFTCDGELKIILNQSAKAKKLNQKDRAKLKANELFDDVSRIIATKNVIIRGKDNKGRPVSAVTQTLSFNKTTGNIILKGKGSRITTPDAQLKVVTNTGYLKLDQNLNASGQGTHTDFNLPENKK